MMLPEFLHFVIDPVLFDRYASRMLDGLWITVKLVLISFFIGMVLAVVLALFRVSRNPVLDWLAKGYILFFRGTPLLAQLFLLYYGIGSLNHFWKEVGLWWFFRDAWFCSLLAFSLNTAAYQAEIFRASLQAVPKGQHEAAAVLGISPTVSFFKIILPQALLIALRPLGNEMIILIKASALVYMVTIFDLMGVTRQAYFDTFKFQVFIWAAVLYLLLVETLRRILLFVERRLSVHLD